jgi:hypothetical protein
MNVLQTHTITLPLISIINISKLFFKNHEKDDIIGTLAWSLIVALVSLPPLVTGTIAFRLKSLRLLTSLAFAGMPATAGVSVVADVPAVASTISVMYHASACLHP